jgi:predicted deacetylase
MNELARTRTEARRPVVPQAEPLLCVVLHDVASSTLAACERMVRAIDEVAVLPLTLLAVPRYHHEMPTPALEQWLLARSLAGDELALHGYTHQDDGTPRDWLDRLRRRHYTRGEGEFWALDEAEVRNRLYGGIDWFRRNGWPLHGFVAPAWLAGPATWRPMRELGFDYTCTLRHIHLLREERRITSQSLVYSTSSAWRRHASVAWNTAVGFSERANPVLRLELHPHDADHRGVRRSWQGLLERHLHGRSATTLAQVAERTVTLPLTRGFTTG